MLCDIFVLFQNANEFKIIWECSIVRMRGDTFLGLSTNFYKCDVFPLVSGYAYYKNAF